MKGGARNQPAAAASQPQPVPPSPTTKGTAKYTNKDGSKFITVPKIATPVEAPQPSPATSNASGPRPQPNQAASAGANGPAPAPVNRKKQKRRAKAAAKAAAEAGLSSEHPNGLPSPAASTSHGSKHLDAEPADESDDEDEHFHDSHHHLHGQGNGYADPSGKSKKSKKKKKKGSTPGPVAAEVEPPHQHVSSPPPMVHRGSGISKEKIWNTSSQEERERIKEFWLGLGEDERKSLVKVEKDAVLKKMKEQQKHTCSCTVCGRKRTAIEEELEGLYDAYYEELEQFANHPHQHGDPPMMGSSRNFGLHANRSLPGNYSGHQPSRGRIVENLGDEEDEEGDEEYSEDELDDDEYSDDEPEEIHRDYATDFFNFGNSLTVQGGILTVADDLLKNDGKKFIEMMEQLAERRMAREEDAKEQAYPRAYGHNINGGNLLGHNHPPPPPVDEDDYEEEDEDEEEYDESQEDEYDEEEDTMTEEQRMEEGRRMFQIFAARMFEQRVLTAYREKVAKERQQKLIEELDEETRQDSQRKAKKAKEAQKRKEKAAQKKAALAEEKARKDAEKAAEIEARLQQEAARAEEAKLKAEEKRKKKEAQKKAEEEERLRKEAERQRRIHEQKERQAEQERKAREAKDREKKAREDAKLKEKEARDRKDREVRERKEKPDSDKPDKDLKVKPEKEIKEKQKQEEKVAQKVAALSTSGPITLPKRPSQHQSNPVPALPQQPPTSFASPQIAVATPALPKAPTPIRPRQASQQDVSAASSHPASQSGSGTSQNASPSANTPVHRSPAASGVSGKTGPLPTQPAQAMSPLQSAAKVPSTSQPGMFNMPPLGMAFPPGLPQQMPPGFGNRMHHDPMFPPIGAGFRPGPNMMPIPPGLNGPMNGRGFPIPHPPPGFPQATPDQLPGPFPGSLPKDSVPPTHSRQPSGGFEPSSAPSTQPISRPAPIGRPGSVVHGQRPTSESPASAVQRDFDDMQSHHLGSSALLDDSDEPLLPSIPDFGPNARRGTAAPGPAGRPGFPPAPFGGIDPATLFHTSSVWGHPSQPPPGINPFGSAPPPPPGFGPAAWASPTPAFSGPGGIGRPSQPRSVTIRQMLCRVCRDLSEKSKQSGSVSSTPDGSKKSEPTTDGFISLDAIKAQVDLLNPTNERPVSEDDLLALCETEGNMQNGGGSFDVREDGPHRFIRWVPSMNNGIGPDGLPHLQRAVGAPGEIGSPVIGSGWGR